MYFDLHTATSTKQEGPVTAPAVKEIAQKLAALLPGSRVTVASVDGATVGFFETTSNFFTPEERANWIEKVAKRGASVRCFNDKTASETTLRNLFLQPTLSFREACFKGFEHLNPAFMAAFAKARPNLCRMDLRKTKETYTLLDAFLKSLQEEHALVKKRMSEPERSEEEISNFRARLGDLDEKGIVFRVGGSDLTTAQKKELHLRYPFAALEDPEETLLDLSRPEELSSESSLTFKQIAFKAKQLPKLQSIDLSGYKGCFCLFSLLALEKEKSIQIRCEAPAELIVPAWIEVGGEKRAPNCEEIRDVLRRFYKEPVTTDLRQVVSFTPFDLLYLEEEFPVWKWIAPPLTSCTLPLFDIRVVEHLCKRFSEIQIELTHTSLAQEKELFNLLDLFPTVRFSNKERVTHLLEDLNLMKSYLKRSLLKNLCTNLSDEELSNLADSSQPLSLTLRELISKIQAFRTDADSSSPVTLTKEIDAIDLKPKAAPRFQPLPPLSPALTALVKKFGNAPTTTSSATFIFGSSTPTFEKEKGADEKAPAAPAADPSQPLNHPFGFSRPRKAQAPTRPWHSPIPSPQPAFGFSAASTRTTAAFGQANSAAPKFGFSRSAFSNQPTSFNPFSVGTHASPIFGYSAPQPSPAAAVEENQEIPRPKETPHHEKTTNPPQAINDELLNAALKGDVKEVERLLTQGADINALGKYGERPLLLAALKGIEPLIELLLERGADVNVVDLQGNSPLHLAAENGLVKSVKLLIGKGANVLTKNTRGILPIETALEAEMRLKKGTFQTPNRDYPGVLYQLNFCFIIFPSLKEFAEKNPDPVNSYTKLFFQNSSLQERYLNHAIDCNHPEVVNILLANGTKSRRQGSSDPFLLNAVSKGSRDIVYLLLSNGERRSPNDLIHPLFIAVEKGSLEIVKLLLIHGAAVNEKLSGKFALLIAVEKGYKEIAELLIATGADINAQSDGQSSYYGYPCAGDRALHAAVRQGNLALVTLLIEKGAAVNASGSYGTPPLDLAIGKNFDEIAALLIERGANVNPTKETAQPFFGISRIGINGPLHFTAANGNLRLTELLIAKGADVNAKGLHGYVPLHFAAEKGHVEVVKFLLAKGANPQLYNDQRMLPIHLASKCKNSEVMELLSKA